MKITNTSIEVSKLSNGNALSIEVVQYQSETPGPHIYIQANVHGAELQGNLVIAQLMDYFAEHEFSGKLTFVPFANPLASTQSMGGYTYGRFNARTGDNWNRNYTDVSKTNKSVIGGSIAEFVNKVTTQGLDSESITENFKQFLNACYEKLLDVTNPYAISENKYINTILQKLACDADVVLDLHTGGRATRYIYAAEFEQKDAIKMGFPHTLIIPNEFDGALDEACFMPWVTLRKSLQSMNLDFEIPIKAYTVELGSEEDVNSEDAKLDCLKILNYLKEIGTHQNMIEVTSEPQYFCSLKDYRSYFAATGGLCEYLVEPATHFNKGDPLACIHQFDKLQYQWKKVVIKANNNGIMINRATSSNIMQGEVLFQVMENYSCSN